MTEIDAMTARAVLHAFWWSKGETIAGVYAQALLAAYELGDQKEFADVLCEVASPHEGVVTFPRDRGGISYKE